MRCKSIGLILFLVLLRVCAAEDQLPFQRGIELIRAELGIARNGVRAMSLAAHPDDEDGATLTYLRNIGVETHICLVTRGEGGQNERGPELGAALAAIRTQETESAAKILGSKVWYLNLPDFGFSKTTEETLEIWNQERALAQLVRVIRIVRPHIVFTMHHPDRPDHGHHRATGKLIIEAFDAAADPKRFSKEMEEDGSTPWQVRKLYIRPVNEADATLSIDVGARDPISGLSPTQVAAAAVARHVSQGMYRDVKPGTKEVRHFTLVKQIAKPSAPAKETSMLDGLAISTRDALREKIDAALKQLSPTIVADGSVARAMALAASEEKKITLDGEEATVEAANDVCVAQHLSVAMAEALGLKVYTTLSDNLTTWDETVEITVHAVNDGPLPVLITGGSIAAEKLWKIEFAPDAKKIGPGEAAQFTGKATAITQADRAAKPNFPAEDWIFSRIESRPPLQVRLNYAIDEDAHRKTELTIAEWIPLDLALPRTNQIRPNPVLIFDSPDNDSEIWPLARFRVAITNRRKLADKLQLFAGIEDKTDIPPVALTFEREDDTQSGELKLFVPNKQLNKGPIDVNVTIYSKDEIYGGPAANVRRVPIRLPASLNVGIVKTYDEATYSALRDLENAGMGLTVTALTPDDLRIADLNKYHTIILDIRATQYRPEVRQVRARLLQFMRDGGNVVCMYHKDFDWNAADDKDVRGRGFFKGVGGGGEIAPYPIELSFNRVTNEQAEVRMLKPGHTLLSEPCKLQDKDFTGWVQERGVYFPKSWAPEYTALLSSNDKGEPALDGGLLVADVGTGSFIYSSYVLYRQLRAGVPGAYRLLANMISYPRIKRKR
jgi:LmbE family N-acetylglucosaminyl deacetylase